MSNVLYLRASPRQAGSHSSRASGRFFATLLEAAPDTRTDEVDLWQAELPAMTGSRIEAKYATLAGVPHDAAQAEAWSQVKRWVAQLAASDRLVISTPMWNFGIPYVLKHWFDVVTQPRLTFSFSPENGYRPLLSDRPTLVIIASSGDYRSGASWGRPDLATPYLKAALDFIGLKDVTFVAVGPTVGSPDAIKAGETRANAALDEVAESWAVELAAGAA